MFRFRPGTEGEEICGRISRIFACLTRIDENSDDPEISTLRINTVAMADSVVRPVDGAGRVLRRDLQSRVLQLISMN